MTMPHALPHGHALFRNPQQLKAFGGAGRRTSMAIKDAMQMAMHTTIIYASKQMAVEGAVGSEAGQPASHDGHMRLTQHGSHLACTLLLPRLGNLVRQHSSLVPEGCVVMTACRGMRQHSSLVPSSLVPLRGAAP